MVSYNLNIMQDILNKIHPKQIINKVDNLKVSLFEVSYEYTTLRGNNKKGKKYFLLNQFNPQADLKKELEKYVQDYNNNNEHRQISNVKFLDGQCLGFLSI